MTMVTNARPGHATASFAPEWMRRACGNHRHGEGKQHERRLRADRPLPVSRRVWHDVRPAKRALRHHHIPCGKANRSGLVEPGQQRTPGKKTNGKAHKPRNRR